MGLKPEATRRRALLYWPVALVITAALVGGIIWLITAENTALAFVPPPEPNVPAVSTPVVTAAPAATEAATAAAPAEGGEATTAPAPAGSATWANGIGELFQTKCGSCHGAAAMGGLGLDTYSGALSGGAKGPGIVPNNPDQSQVVIVQKAGNHPGMFTAEELQQVIDWINAGAPEQ